MAYDPVIDTRKIMAGSVVTVRIKNEYLSGARDGTTSFKGALAAYKAVRAAEEAAVQIGASIGSLTLATSLAAPILSNMATGWVTGQKPPTWNNQINNVVPYETGFGGSSYRIRWRLDGGAWTTEAWQGIDDELLTGVFIWPLLNAASLSGLFEVQGQHGVNVDITGENLSPWSNTWSDTLPSSVTTALLRAEILEFGFGSGPVSPTAFSCQSGDKIVLHFAGLFNGAPRTITSVTANSGAITFTNIGSSGSTINERVYSFYANTTGVTSIALTVNVGGSTNCILLQAVAVRNAATGAPASSHHEIRTVTGEDPHDIDGGLVLPANGKIILTAALGTAAYTFTGATEYTGAEVGNGTLEGSSAEQGVAGNVTILGNNSGGPGFGPLNIVDTAWSP